MRLSTWSAAILLLLSAPLAYSEDAPSIAVGTARTKKTVLAIPDVRAKAGAAAAGPSAADSAKTVHETILSDLTFMDLFKFIDRAGFVENVQTAGIAPGSFKMPDWSSIGVEFLLKSELSREGNTINLEAYLYDVGGAKTVFARRYPAPVGEAKNLAHTVAGDIVTALTGQASIFQTKIVMSCDRTGKKEIYMMDFDGTNVKQLTSHRSIALAPAWAPDSSKIVYSLYTKHKSNVKNLDLYELNFKTNTVRMLSNRKGINSGAAFSPDGKKIALTMSFLGNPEIFWLDAQTNTVTRLTKSLGFDVDPAWSPDGKSLAFVSSRSGMPMVFSMSVDGAKVQRLTYAGRYNATPSWSPKGDKLVFAGWIDGRFDIFTMNSDGTTIERLTKDQGNNEDPFFSPDGTFIIFSSNRTGQQNIYVMNLEGTYVKRLTYGLGNCVAPKWSNPPRSGT